MLPGSSAVDAGDPNFDVNGPDGVQGTSDDIPFDQRGTGFDRVIGTQVDIGSYEFREDASLIVTTNQDVVSNTDGLTSLREAIAYANSGATPADTDGDPTTVDLIGFDAGVFTGGAANLILLIGGELNITDAVLIDANELPENIVIDAQQNSRVIRFSVAVGNLNLDSLTIKNGRTTATNEGGGGIRFDSGDTLTLTGSTVTESHTTERFSEGGGIYSRSGNVMLTNSTVSGSSTLNNQTSGGGIFAQSGDVTLTNSTLSGNSTSGYSSHGGGIHAKSGNVAVTSSTINGNRTSGNGAKGGGIFAESGNVMLTNSTVTGKPHVGGGRHRRGHLCAFRQRDTHQ